MGYNLPDDWGSYYRKCYTCGYKYHLSGVEQCACTDEPEEVDLLDSAECECCAADWDCRDYDDATCRKCGTGPYRETVKKTKIVRAKKRHHTPSGQYIEPGERYKSVFTRGYYPNGPTRMTYTKFKLKEAA